MVEVVFTKWESNRRTDTATQTHIQVSKKSLVDQRNFPSQPPDLNHTEHLWGTWRQSSTSIQTHHVHHTTYHLALIVVALSLVSVATFYCAGFGSSLFLNVKNDKKKTHSFLIIKTGIVKLNLRPKIFDVEHLTVRRSEFQPWQILPTHHINIVKKYNIF